MSRPPRIPNWLPDDQSTIYFITFCVEERKPVLANSRTWSTCCDVFEKLDQRTILSALAMPDHIPMLAAPADRDASVSSFAKWFKRWFNQVFVASSSSQPVRKLEPTWKWQEGCFDRLLRSDESLSEKWEYIRQNPVRAGLVSVADDWPYQFQSNE